MKFSFIAFLFFSIPVSAGAWTLNQAPKKDTAEFTSGLNIMGGGYFSVNDATMGFQAGAEIFGCKRKFQDEVQGFAKFSNNKPDYQLAALFGRKANFNPKFIGVFSGGIGCEFENIAVTTPVYGNFGLVVGTKTTYAKGQYWGVKLQVEFFERTPGFTLGQFVSFFAGNDYQDVELGMSLTLGKN